MKKFKTQIREVEAEQYILGKEELLKGVTVVNPQIIFSLNRELFYVTHTPEMAKCWLSVLPKEDGKYEALEFAFYKVKSGDTEPLVPENRNLVDLYLKLFDLSEPVPCVYFKDKDDKSVILNDTDWLVRDNGELKRYTDKEFKVIFQE